MLRRIKESKIKQKLAKSVLTLKVLYLAIMVHYFTKFNNIKRVQCEFADFNRYRKLQNLCYINQKWEVFLVCLSNQNTTPYVLLKKQNFPSTYTYTVVQHWQLVFCWGPKKKVQFCHFKIGIGIEICIDIAQHLSY